MIEREIISIVYEPATGKTPAMVDISWYDSEKSKNGYATLFGKAAKALSQLQPGQIYFDYTDEEK